MAFKQIISSAKVDSLEPCVTVLESGVIFNPASVDEIGKDNERAVVFYDKETNRLAFCFMKAKMSGSYSFAQIVKSRSRRVGIGRFLKRNEILQRANGTEFPLQELKETVPDFEGSRVFAVNLSSKKPPSTTRSEQTKKLWADPVWKARQRKRISEGKLAANKQYKEVIKHE